MVVRGTEQTFSLLFVPFLLYIGTTSAFPTNLTFPSSPAIQLPTFRGMCVDEKRYPDWEGPLSNNDCYAAETELRSYFPTTLDRKYTFWAPDVDGSTPPPDGWELPVVISHGSCTILIQITKMFGNDVIPFYQGGYLPVGKLPATLSSSWENVIGAIMAVRQQCVKVRNQPGWADVEGVAGRKAAIVLLLPDDSDMAEEWAGDVLKGLIRGGTGDLTATS